MADTSPLINGVKAGAEALILPGSSLIMDGDIKNGAIHAAAGIGARALLGPLGMLGPIGWLTIGANSFSRSVSGKNIYQHFFASKT